MTVRFHRPTVYSVTLQSLYRFVVGDTSVRLGPGWATSGSSGTELAVDRYDLRSVSVPLEVIGVGDRLTFTDASAWAAYRVTAAPTLNEGYVLFDVELVEGESSVTALLDGAYCQLVGYPESLLEAEYVAPTWGLRFPTADELRYCDLAALRLRLGIVGSAWDDPLTQAALSAEHAVDEALGRSFPDPQPFGEVFAVPAGIVQAAENVAVAVFKALDAPGGLTGSDEWFGSLDLSEVARQELRRSATMLGFKRRFGVG